MSSVYSCLTAYIWHCRLQWVPQSDTWKMLSLIPGSSEQLLWYLNLTSTCLTGVITLYYNICCSRERSLFELVISYHAFFQTFSFFKNTHAFTCGWVCFFSPTNIASPCFVFLIHHTNVINLFLFSTLKAWFSQYHFSLSRHHKYP